MPPAVLDPETSDLQDDRTGDDSPEVQSLRYAISSYGADYPVDSLIKRLRDGSIYVPQFQRGFVWDVKDASRFIESLLLGLPVPSIFLSKEPDSGKLLVVDGQQRLTSLLNFYEGAWPPSGKKEFALKGVLEEFAGRTYKTLRDEDRRRLDDSILHATVFKQDEPSKDESGVYQVFERLNSGAKKLTPQEIRSAVHLSGQIRTLLGELNCTAQWREIYGPEDARMRDQELILRFLAMLYEESTYEKPMVFFLNRFMGTNKVLSEARAAEMRSIFCDTIAVIFESVGPTAFRPAGALNAAVFDAVMVGTAKRLQAGPVSDPSRYKEAYDKLLRSPKFLDACGRGTADVERVRKRLELSTGAFARIP